MVWYFISVYIINKTSHGRLEIRNFSSRVEKIFHSFAALTRKKRNFVSPSDHVISSIYGEKNFFFWNVQIWKRFKDKTAHLNLTWVECFSFPVGSPGRKSTGRRRNTYVENEKHTTLSEKSFLNLIFLYLWVSETTVFSLTWISSEFQAIFSRRNPYILMVTQQCRVDAHACITCGDNRNISFRLAHFSTPPKRPQRRVVWRYFSSFLKYIPRFFFPVLCVPR